MAMKGIRCDQCGGFREAPRYFTVQGNPIDGDKHYCDETCLVISHLHVASYGHLKSRLIELGVLTSSAFI